MPINSVLSSKYHIKSVTYLYPHPLFLTGTSDAPPPRTKFSLHRLTLSSLLLLSLLSDPPLCRLKLARLSRHLHDLEIDLPNPSPP
jgi:hypothetical protein